MALANLVFHPSTWSTTVYCYLEDMFVAPTARGPSVALDLISCLLYTSEVDIVTGDDWVGEAHDAVVPHAGGRL